MVSIGDSQSSLPLTPDFGRRSPRAKHVDAEARPRVSRAERCTNEATEKLISGEKGTTVATCRKPPSCEAVATTEQYSSTLS